MTFTVNNADLDATIKTYQNDNDIINIKYLSGREQKCWASYSEEKRLNDKMLNQAVYRDENFDLSNLEFRSVFLKCTLLAQGVLLNLAKIKNLSWLNPLIIIFVLVTLFDLYKVSYQIRELYKYRIFLEMKDKLSLVRESELLKCVEFDSFYQKPLNIATLDEYSYSDIKRIRVKLNEMLKEANSR